MNYWMKCHLMNIQAIIIKSKIKSQLLSVYTKVF